jgi:hypothetical protein
MAMRNFHVYTKQEGSIAIVYGVNMAAIPGVDPDNYEARPTTQNVTLVRRYSVPVDDQGTLSDSECVSNAIESFINHTIESDANPPQTEDVWHPDWTAWRNAGVPQAIDPGKPLPTVAEVTQGRVRVSAPPGAVPNFIPSQIEVVDHVAQVRAHTHTVTATITGTIDPSTGVIANGVITETHTETNEVAVTVDHF